MIPWRVLARAVSPRAGSLILARRGDEFAIRIDGVELMNSRNTVSERALAQRACAKLAGLPRPRILIGGLGMGFTASETLRQVGPGAQVEICELLPEIVQWNQEWLGDLCGRPLGDKRVKLHVADVAQVAARRRGGFDAILLDVDNGPDALTSPTNAALYSPAGLAALRRALAPGGVLAVWSAFASAGFGRRLVAAGFREERERINAHGAQHFLWIAVRSEEAAPPLPADARRFPARRVGKSRRRRPRGAV